MILTRRLLTPIISWFIIIVLTVVGFGLYFSQRGTLSDENTSLGRQVETFYSRLDSLKNFALALATETASNPEVQAAFANQDREKLTELTLPGYLAVDSQFDVPQAQFHLPPATSFLRLHQLDQYGDDLSAFRFTVLTANGNRSAVGGLEIGRGGLGMRGVVPVSYKNRHIGTFEYGVNVDLTLLTQMSSQFGDDWQILLLRHPAEVATFTGAVGVSEGPTPDFILQASTLETPIFAEPDAYIRVSSGERVVSRIEVEEQRYAIITAPIYDYSGTVIGIINVIKDRTETVRISFFIFSGLGLIAFLGIAIGSISLSAITRRMLQPIATLKDTAMQIAEGDLDLQASTDSPDEIGQLGLAFNSMTAQLKNLISGLEERVQERTQEMAHSAEQLRLVADVASSTASIREIDRLLHTVAQLISERFNIYHAGIFLLDENNDFAILQAANSLGGRAMLSRGHRLKVGEQGIVGKVTETGKPRIALDVGDDAVYFDNPDLPETRSEMALPLKLSGEVIGAIDLQSKEANAFSQDDVDILSILADQVAIAIQNARSFESAQQAIRDAEIAFQQVTGDTWQRFAKAQETLGYHFDGTRTKIITEAIEPDPTRTLRIPVQLRGKEIGILNLRGLDSNRTWSIDEIAIAGAAAERVALALETARLLEEAQRRAAKEQTIGEISTEIGASVNLDNILQTAIREMGRILPGAEVSIQVHREE